MPGEGENPATDPPTKTFKLPWFGFEIERRTDFLALAAFSIALITGGYQLVGFVRGFDVVPFQPEQVVFIAEDSSEAGRFVRIQARMAYVNKGQPGYNAAIAKEAVSFELGGRTYQQVWQDFQDLSSKNGELIWHEKKPARPMPIAAGSAISHETYFAVHPKHCDPGDTTCEKWGDRLSLREFFALLGEKKELALIFRTELYGGSPVEIPCTINVDMDFFGNLGIRHWAAPLCRPEE